MQATAHIDFIAAAYGAGIVVIGALIAWVVLDYRMQRASLPNWKRKGSRADPRRCASRPNTPRPRTHEHDSRPEKRDPERRERRRD
jgi:heme exporter protein CcmD